MLIDLLNGGEAYTDYRDFELDYFKAIKAIMDNPYLISEITFTTVEQQQRLGYMLQVALWLMPENDDRIWLQNTATSYLNQIKPVIHPINIWTRMTEKALNENCASAFRWMIMNPISYSRFRQFIETGLR